MYCVLNYTATLKLSSTALWDILSQQGGCGLGRPRRRGAEAACVAWPGAQGRRLKNEEELKEADFAAYLGTESEEEDEEEEEEAPAQQAGGQREAGGEDGAAPPGKARGKEDANALRERYRWVQQEAKWECGVANGICWGGGSGHAVGRGMVPRWQPSNAKAGPRGDACPLGTAPQGPAVGRSLGWRRARARGRQELAGQRVGQ